MVEQVHNVSSLTLYNWN